MLCAQDRLDGLAGDDRLGGVHAAELLIAVGWHVDGIEDCLDAAEQAAKAGGEEKGDCVPCPTPRPSS
jgi:hypothetical protein